MRSIIAEAHFDGSRNVIALLGGLRRYILTHPSQCKHMHMFPPGHPSGTKIYLLVELKGK